MTILSTLYTLLDVGVVIDEEASSLTSLHPTKADNTKIINKNNEIVFLINMLIAYFLVILRISSVWFFLIGIYLVPVYS